LRNPRCAKAICAIALVLVNFMGDLMKAPVPASDPKNPYFAALERLTAEDWRPTQGLVRPSRTE
jgi:hypothetical protein